MKAKMTDKQPEAGKYLCTLCGKEFAFKKGTLFCPRCKSKRPSDFVAIHMHDDKEE